MSEFLPDNYQKPEGDYMKFLEGENTFRVVSSAITGFEYWNKDGKPVRLREYPDQLPEDIRWTKNAETGKEEPEKIRHFWAFCVWSYRAKKVQILEVTQQGVQDAIRALTKNPKWGSPKEYDLTVTRAGSGFDTSYGTMPNPKEELPEQLKLIAAQKVKKINLEKLFEGGNPFE